MTIRVFNTLTRRTERLMPLKDGTVRLYTCGPTVYAGPHLGHARSTVVFDVIVRYLRARGYAVTHVRNITDIDDKLVARARSAGRDFQSLAAEYTACYRHAMQRLNALAPDSEPRATDYIPQIQSCIADLLENGHAYCAGGSVYFTVPSCQSYGRLSGRSLASLPGTAGRLADPAKRHPVDFVLWKAARAQEPAWPSPWGPGRPGWHIECTAMCAALLGEQFDIHGGGADLVFPHHENEIAQSVSLFGRIPARYWLHHGLVQIRGEKMAKSLGNGLDLAALQEKFTPGTLRLFLLSRRYRHPVDYSRRALQAAGKQDRRLQRFFTLVGPAIGKPQTAAGVKNPYWLAFCDAMNNDFNFPRALAVVFEGVRAVNREIGCGPGKREFRTGTELARTAALLFFICSDILGLDARTWGSNNAVTETTSASGLNPVQAGGNPEEGAENEHRLQRHVEAVGT